MGYRQAILPLHPGKRLTKKQGHTNWPVRYLANSVPNNSHQKTGRFYDSVGGASVSRERSDDRLVVQKDTSVVPATTMVACVLHR